MAQDEQVPLYPEGGSLEEDLRRIARFSNNSTGATTQNGANGATAPPATTTTAPVVDSGDPDTDELIHRMLREDAEEDNTGGDDNESAQDEPDPEAERRNIIESYFSCIRTSNSELISAFIDGGIVTPNTKSDTGETPLVAAVRANHVRIVQQLVDYGADVNEMTEENQPLDVWYRGRYQKHDYDVLQRTPLMVAAENGHLPLVKLFVEVFHAKDDIVPMDGMTALRLAAQNGHREVVDYLPSRRIGGMQRWKYKNRKSIRRAKGICIDIYKFNKVIFFEIPKFFLWSIPKHLVVIPIRDSAVYLWKHKKDIADSIRNFFIGMGKAIVKGAKEAAIGTVKGIKAIPSATVRAIKATGRGIVKAAKATWKFTTKDLPRWIVRFIKGTARFLKRAAIWTKDTTISFLKALKKFAVWLAKQLWKTLTVRLPKALKAVVEWIATVGKYCGNKTMEFVLRIASAIHTLVTKIINWVSGITWKDVWNGFVSVFEFIFVEIPLMFWNGIIHTGKFIKKLLETLFGWVGTCFWYLGVGIIFLVAYVPKKIFELIMVFFSTIGRGLHEVAVWINPKTV